MTVIDPKQSAATADRQAARDRLIVALDAPTRADAERLIDRIGPAASFYKIGLELLFGGGLDLARDLKAEGKRVFLDLKFLDIANTVRHAVKQAAALGVDLLTIHGHDTKTLSAAVEGRNEAGSQTKLLAVTVLTSLDATDLAEQTSTRTPAELVAHRARLAHAVGIDGVVASGQEAASVRALAPPPFLIVTPGIRLPSDDAGDQSRITTPQDAIRAGATHLVVGRPITRAADPADAARRFTEAIAAAAA